MHKKSIQNYVVVVYLLTIPHCTSPVNISKTMFVIYQFLRVAAERMQLYTKMLNM